MKEVSLSGSARQNVGKKDAKAVRLEGRVPCVVYGSGKQTHFSVKHTDMEKLLYTPEVSIINLDVEGTTVKSIIQDVQYHPVTDRIHHIDFLELKDDKKVKMNIPVVLSGRSKGVLNGGKLQQIFRSLKVYALPGELPDTIDIDITELKIGDAIRVRDIIAKGMNVLNAASAVIVSVKTARGVLLTEEEEEAEEAAAAAAAADSAEGGEEASSEG